MLFTLYVCNTFLFHPEYMYKVGDFGQIRYYLAPKIKNDKCRMTKLSMIMRMRIHSKQLNCPIMDFILCKYM